MVRQTSLTNGTGLAKYSDEFAKNSQGEILKACNIFRVTELPIVDFLFVIDDTYSMEPYQTQLTEATTEIFEAIQSSFVSARWTVASTEVGEDYDYDGSESHCGVTSSPQGPTGIWAPFSLDYEDSFHLQSQRPAGRPRLRPLHE